MLQKTVSDARFPRLFTPGYIGKLWIKNRLIKAPTCTRLADSQGYVTERMINHYRELARGGVGLIVTEYTNVDDRASQSIANQLSASRDDMSSGLDWLAVTIKDNGAGACLQLSHAGLGRILGRPPVKSASSFSWSPSVPVSQELTTEEIAELVQAFGDAALRAKKAGFDMVEVHGAHGYLIANFLSPRYNRRSDGYGGSLANRMRFLLEIVARVRQRVGDDFPISVRLSATDYEPVDPITLADIMEVAKSLEKASVNAIHVSSGGHMTLGRDEGTMYTSPRNSTAWATQEIKKVVGIPVIAVRSFNTPDVAEKVLAEGKADFVALGRPLLVDPYYPLKAREGRPEDIRPCIRCSDGCYDRGIYIGSIKCTVNPVVGRENELRLMPASKPKRVAVVGGGPAGLEAARVAAAKGHKVTLFEKSGLGGMLIPASIPEFKTDLRYLMSYLITQVEKAGVTIVREEATLQTIKKGNFEAVIVATGATPSVPDIPGFDRPGVINPLDAFRGARTGGKVIVVGGGMIGSDLALFLAENGKRVAITTRGNEIARGLSARERVAFFMRLSKYDVDIRTGARLEEVTDSGIVITDKAGVRTEIQGDNVILAAGMTPDRGLFDGLVGKPFAREVYAVGDCVEPRTIFEAIHEGYAVASNLV